MKGKQIAPDLYVSPQIDESDVAAAADAGVRAIICNRPDGEAPNQPPADTIRRAAQARGMAFHYIPVTGATLGAEAAQAFAAARATEGKTLAYCGSGMRSTALWALAQAKTRPAREVLAAAAAAGFDLSGLAPRIQAMAVEQQPAEQPGHVAQRPRSG